MLVGDAVSQGESSLGRECVTDLLLAMSESLQEMIRVFVWVGWGLELVNKPAILPWAPAWTLDFH